MIKSYKKKPVVIEAIQYTGDPDNIDELKEFVTCGFKTNKDNTLTVPTLEGEHIASIGDYIIKGVEGEFYPCKPRIFNKTYDEVKMNIDELILNIKDDELKRARIIKENGRYRGDIQLSDPTRNLDKEELVNVLNKLKAEITLFSDNFTKSINDAFFTKY